ncbi:dienelactone hydrolase family protein [Pedobacter deserti]|uniref:dienelactone hydrolase family protein n=1 Tax=Pedobacter deserti TaxID=2817382 RepID=UPI00210D072A|nr:dienelactone hydrolase family protein [Pedobacter sp. SYSU D00382]
MMSFRISSLPCLCVAIVMLFSLSPISLLAQLKKGEAEQFAAAELEKQRALQKVHLASVWQQKVARNGEYTLKFQYRVLGEKPADGRSLYISMHGGGGTTAAANDQQWKNQIGLYTPKEGIYLAPRAPTDTWNLWHQEHIDTLFTEVIKAAMLMEDVNPNKIYITGYSAGGDGTFQLAPRLAPYWAAAAMMAGHPGDAAAINLRNLPFAIYMGGKDAAYKRNELAAVWGKKLDSLAAANPGDFIHEVEIYPDMPHWMNRKDTVAMPWLASFRRKTLPSRVSWQQDDVLRDQFYWLGAPRGKGKAGALATVSVSGNTVQIEHNTHPALLIYLNDELLNLDKKVKVTYQGKTLFNKRVKRDKRVITQTAAALDPDRVFSAVLLVENGQVRQW